MLYQRERRRDEALKLFERFKKLNSEELAGGSFTVRKIYGTVGKYYMALDADALPLKPTEQTPSYRIVFSPETIRLPVTCEVWRWEKITVNMPGVAVADLDGDEDLDLVLCGAGADGKTQIWVNDGEGGFSPGALLTDHGVAPVVADVDNDGDVDLFVGRAGSDQLYLGDGAGHFRETSLSGTTAAEERFTACARLIDVDSDGDVDLFAARFGPDGMPAANALLNNNRDGTYTEIAPQLGIDLPRDPVTAVLWNDWDADRDIDLLFFSVHASPRLWVNDRAGAFRFFGAEHTGLTLPGAVSGTVGDYDGDGAADVVVFSGGRVRLFRNLGKGRF
ncbi:MAG: VCBS repeat-containing protein, partial [Planctomycetota bacterium]